MMKMKKIIMMMMKNRKRKYQIVSGKENVDDWTSMAWHDRRQSQFPFSCETKESYSCVTWSRGKVSNPSVITQGSLLPTGRPSDAGDCVIMSIISLHKSHRRELFMQCRSVPNLHCLINCHYEISANETKKETLTFHQDWKMLLDIVCGNCKWSKERLDGSWWWNLVPLRVSKGRSEPSSIVRRRFPSGEIAIVVISFKELAGSVLAALLQSKMKRERYSARSTTVTLFPTGLITCFPSGVNTKLPLL